MFRYVVNWQRYGDKAGMVRIGLRRGGGGGEGGGEGLVSDG